MMRRTVLLVLLVFLTAAAGYIFHRLGPPTFTLEDLKPADGGREFNPYYQPLSIALRVRNNHLVDLQIEDFKVSLEFASHAVSRVDSPPAVRIGPLREEIVSARAWISLRDLAASALKHERRRYRIETSFRANGETVTQIRDGILGQR